MLADRDRQLLDVIVARVPPKLKSLFRPLLEAEAIQGRWGACTTYSRILAESLTEGGVPARVQSVYTITANKVGWEMIRGRIDAKEAMRTGGGIQIWGEIENGQRFQHAVCFIPGWNTVVDLSMIRRGSMRVPCHPFWAELGHWPWWLMTLEMRDYPLEFHVYETQPKAVEAAKAYIKELIRRHNR